MLSRTHRAKFCLRACRLNPSTRSQERFKCSHCTCRLCQILTKTCVVERHAGPRTCRTMRCHVAVFPEPGGPEINRGGFAWSATRSMVSMVDSSSARSEKRRGGWVSSQLAMRIIQRQRSLTICVNSLCLECLLLASPLLLRAS